MSQSNHLRMPTLLMVGLIMTISCGGQGGSSKKIDKQSLGSECGEGSDACSSEQPSQEVLQVKKNGKQKVNNKSNGAGGGAAGASTSQANKSPQNSISTPSAPISSSANDVILVDMEEPRDDSVPLPALPQGNSAVPSVQNADDSDPATSVSDNNGAESDQDTAQVDLPAIPVSTPGPTIIEPSIEPSHEGSMGQASEASGEGSSGQASEPSPDANPATGYLGRMGPSIGSFLCGAGYIESLEIEQDFYISALRVRCSDGSQLGIGSASGVHAKVVNCPRGINGLEGKAGHAESFLEQDFNVGPMAIRCEGDATFTSIGNSEPYRYSTALQQHTCPTGTIASGIMFRHYQHLEKIQLVCTSPKI